MNPNLKKTYAQDCPNDYVIPCDIRVANSVARKGVRLKTVITMLDRRNAYIEEDTQLIRELEARVRQLEGDL